MRGQKFPPPKIFCTKLSWLDSERSEQKTDTDNKRKVISPSWLHTGQFCCNWCRLDIASLATFEFGLTRRQSYILRTKLTFRLIMLRVTLSMLDIASFATFQPIRGCFSLKSSSAQLGKKRAILITILTAEQDGHCLSPKILSRTGWHGEGCLHDDSSKKSSSNSVARIAAEQSGHWTLESCNPCNRNG